ncbi:FMN-binding protein [Dethiobacter alkaliphilus]|uniref:FMN-binding domain protein n=1 Tax=Dethiobacter alkaliphilus AHT 1 TaxID=555088 RepID=C0GIE6_DETAL|nr:FMN-binding protein [Dethiobacter alkaliphilus]EEG76807.1 FMN-binding domain protein [Dethiobacter alkaliphilus AHT 1]
MKKTNKRRALIVVLFALSFVLFGCAQGPDPDGVSAPEDTVDFSRVPDGTHRGTFTYGAFNFVVDVVVADGEVVETIVVQNRDNQPSRDAEEVLDRVVEEQTLNVDAVSGATVSSRTLIKAVENALKRAKQ